MVKYYAVKNGRESGIYRSWSECKNQVHQFPGAEFKSFFSLGDAQKYLGVCMLWTLSSTNLFGKAVRTEEARFYGQYLLYAEKSKALGRTG